MLFDELERRVRALDRLFETEEQALLAADEIISLAKTHIQTLEEKCYGSISGEERQELLDELAKYSKFSFTYEYFCYNDENHDSSAYVTVEGEEDYAYWTMAGVPRTVRKNPVLKLAEEAMGKVTQKR